MKRLSLRVGRRWGARLLRVLALGLTACAGPPLILPPPRTTVAASTSSGASGQPARARIIGDTAELLPGELAEGALGDVRLDNAYVAFVIDRVEAAHGFASSGGQLIDAVALDGGGKDLLRALGPVVGDGFGRAPVNERIELERKSGSALVRVTGHDPSDAELKIVTEYRLADDARALEVVTKVMTGTTAAHQLAVGDSILWGATERFVPGVGLSANSVVKPLSTEAGYLLGLGEGAAYGYVVHEGPLVGTHGVGWSNSQVAHLDLVPHTSGEVHRWVLVGRRADGTLLKDAAQLRGVAVADAEGRVLEESTGRPLTGVRVVLEDGSGAPAAMAQSSGEGYLVVAPPGTYQAHVVTPDRKSVEHIEVELRADRPAVLDLLVSRPGRVRFTIKDDGGKPSPGKLTFLVDGQPALLGPSFANPGGATAATATGEGALPLAPGHYQVVASRGPEFALDRREIDVKPGAETVTDFRLHRVIDWPKLVCADPHEHALPSVDSVVSLADRATGNLAEGLDLLISSDHDKVTDYGPTIAQLGAAAPLAFLPGEEATRNGLGHWNAYPLPLDAKVDATIDEHALRGLSASAVVAALRAAQAGPEGAPRVVQLNHPRAGSIGYFNAIKLDHLALPAALGNDLDAMEIWNGKMPNAFDQVMGDWFALLGAGRPLTGVSGSDAHTIYGQEVGSPRTCVLSGSAITDPATTFLRGLQHQSAFVTNGPFVRANVEGRSFGQVAPALGGAARGRVRLNAEVWAAPWVDVATVELWVGGMRRGRPIVVPPGTAPLRWKGAIDLRVDADSYLVLVVRGKQTLEPVVSRLASDPPPTPLAITNPIYLDHDGDGKYTAHAR